METPTLRLVIVIACYGGVGASLVFHAIWYATSGARLVEHVREHHVEEWRRRGAPERAVRGVFPDVAVWRWLTRPPDALRSDDGFRARRRALLFVVASLVTTSLVLLATAQAFWAALN